MRKYIVHQTVLVNRYTIVEAETAGDAQKWYELENPEDPTKPQMLSWDEDVLWSETKDCKPLQPSDALAVDNGDFVNLRRLL